MPVQIIPFPQELRLRLPTIVGNVDYTTLLNQLQQIDFLLLSGGVEEAFVQLALNRWTVANPKQTPSVDQQIKFQTQSRRALRCNVLRSLLQEDFRGLSCQLAGNGLYQWFCQIGGIDKIQVPSKSQLQRYASWLPVEQMREVLNGLLKNAVESPKKLQLKERLDLDDYFLDTTCMKANIHFPVDWVLLGDAVRTLMKATLLIRKEGLRSRMESPEEFLRRMNRLSIAMTHQRRRSDSKKGRKRVLRQMKKLVRVVGDHAQRHRQLLDLNWDKTQWTRKQAEQILKRMDGVVEQLPAAQKQAHERIIGGRRVDNADKILSLYEKDAHVIVRGKSGASVEFGNGVIMGENRQGVIVDFAFLKDQAPADSQLLSGSLARVKEISGCSVKSVATDRGFHSTANSKMLKEANIFDAMCPRKPEELKERMKDKKFAQMQRRRSQTEGRVGILKNVFLGGEVRAKGYENRELALAWAVLTHDLWVLARMKKVKKVRKKPADLRKAA